MEFGIEVYHHSKEEKFKVVKYLGSELKKDGRPYFDSEGIPYENYNYMAGM